MIDAATLALVFAALFGVIGPTVARRVKPAAGTWLLSLGGLVAAVAGASVLVVLTLPLIGQNAEVAEAGDWSVRSLERHDPTNSGLALLALGALLFLVARTVHAGVRRTRELRASRRVCREMAPLTGELVVLLSDAADAYALPGRPGRIVVTRGMLRSLTAAERRLLIAHERAHLDRHHHRHISAVMLAASLNPLLGRLRQTQALCVERWADEVAASSSGRSATADALTRASSASRSRPAHPVGALAAAATAVEIRVAALLGAPPRLRPHLLGLAALCAFGAVAAAGVALDDARQLFHLASLAAARATH